MSSSARFAELTGEFRQQHFLIGLILSELAAVFELQLVLLKSFISAHLFMFVLYFAIRIVGVRPCMHEQQI